MGDHSILAPTEYIVRAPASFITSMRDSSAVPQTPLRNLHKDFMDVNEELQVFVRVKPIKDEQTCLTISENYVVVNPPRDSVAFKHKNGGGKTVHKFKFNKIYDQNTTQEQLFKDAALGLVQDFLMGQNTLVFTYGATSAGKTYTMQGTVRDVGILPRSLDTIFNSLEHRLLKSPLLKPLALNEVMKLNTDQAEAEELERSILMKGFEFDTSSDTKDSISAMSNGSFKDWNIRPRETSVCTVQNPDHYYSVWVSFYEIYNEQAYDLLDVCDKRKKRVQLRVTEDRKGKFYVKGLKEVCVRSSDEAFRVLLLGKENLHFAATKLNHNSSRSHCVFNVKVIRTNDYEDPTEATVNLMSFCDLAGMERTTKTQSRGERLKEAGNINTSLLILGRCLETMRANNNQHNPLNKVIIPYRDSKLTKILQTFFSGRGRAAMFVSVSPTLTLCDETLHVLKFGALAQDTVIVPDREVSVAETSISQFAPPIRPSRFQQYVRKSISLLSARASVLEPSFNAINEESASDPRERIIELEEELAKLRAEWSENEQKIRDECCSEWSAVMTKLEASWIQRHEETKARYEEFCENRVNMLTNLMNNCMKKRKFNDGEELENIAIQLKNKDDEIDELEHINQRLSEQIDKLKSSLKVSEEGKAELQREITRLQFEAASTNRIKINFCGPELEEEDSDPSAPTVAQLQAKLKTKEELLNEAVIEFHNKNEELNRTQQTNEQLRLEVCRLNETLADLQSQLEKSNLLLADANDRLDAREEELSSIEEKYLKTTGQFGSLNTELREAKRKIREYENRLKDQKDVSLCQNMCEDLQKQLLQAETRLDRVGQENDELRTEVARLKKQRQEDDCQEELETLRERFNKAQLQLSFAQTEVSTLKSLNEDFKSQKENLLDEICHLKKDLELSSSERKQNEANQSEVEKENEQLVQSNRDLRERQTKLIDDNRELQSALSEFEATIRELTAQLENTQRQRDLVEKELTVLATSLSKVRSEKIHLEEKLEARQMELEEFRREIDTIKEEKLQMEVELNELNDQKSSLEHQLEEVHREKKDFDPAEMADRLADLENKLEQREQRITELEQALEEKTQVADACLAQNAELEVKFQACEVKSSKMCGELEQNYAKNSRELEEQYSAKSRQLDEQYSLKTLELEEEHSRKLQELERHHSQQMDELKKDHSKKLEEQEREQEKLTKKMLQQMRRADEHSETIQKLKEELDHKNQKYEKVLERISHLESHSEKLANVQTQLVDKELALREKENQTSSIMNAMEDKNRQIEQLKQRITCLEGLLSEKDQELDRVHSDLKAFLSGHVNLRPLENVKPVRIKSEKHTEDELSQEEDFAAAIVTPTPVKKRGRPKKHASPGSDGKRAEVDENVEIRLDPPSSNSRTRSRVTIKTETPAPVSSSKSTGRSRKNKSEDDVAHPALSLNLPTQLEDVDGTHSVPVVHSKRRLYNSKCPDILLPSKQEDLEPERPQRMSTRSRKQ